MKIFLTGATGYVGSALARRLLGAGHSVVGLARSREKAQAQSAPGMTFILGDLKKPESYAPAARSCGALLHAGFEYGPDAAQADKTATETLAACARAAKGPRLFVYTSGVWVLGPQRGGPADESAPHNPPSIVAWRPAHERLALSAAGGEVSAVVVRPGCVYGERGGLYALMLKSLFDRRKVPLIAGGENRWASVYLDDLAELYRLVVEKRPRREVYHATDGSSDALKAVAEALIDAAGGGTIEELPFVQARRELGPIAEALAMDQRVSSAKARRELGWRPAVASAALHAAELLAEWHEKAAGMVVA